MEEEDSILDLTTKFKKYSGTMRQHLADLLSLKRKGINDKENDSFKLIYNSVLYTLTSIRLNQRELYSVLNLFKINFIYI